MTAAAGTWGIPLPDPTDARLKLEALHATVALEKARVESGETSKDNDELVADMTAIFAWLKGGTDDERGLQPESTVLRDGG